MTIDLVPPIAVFFSVRSPVEIGVFVSGHFAADAVVKDEGSTHSGRLEIETWWTSARERYAYVAEPVGVVVQDGKTAVEAKVTGNFPGSPANLTYVFELEGDLIATLEVH